MRGTGVTGQDTGKGEGKGKEEGEMEKRATAPTLIPGAATACRR